MEDVKNYYADRVSSSTDLFFQVGKTINGKPVSKANLKYIVDQIRDVLDLELGDRVIDIGCGNGLITKLVSEHCSYLIGVEQSAELCETAKQNSNSIDIEYINRSIGDMDIADMQCEKAYMYEVLQHVDYKDANDAIGRIINGLGERGKLFIGGIPDEEKKWDFYNTYERREGLFKALEQDGDPIGFWYHKDFLKCIGEKQGHRVQIIEQHRDLYTSHYRFDVLIQV
jgi:2-polyprenyl-3-methyl-5-hydroxy-6-metoxy-1,4-benzoquinol methylase